MHTNGLRRTDALLGGMSPLEASRAFQRHNEATDARAASGEDTAHPQQMGYAMVLNARATPVYGDVRRVAPATVARRRAANKAARKARRIGRNR